MMAVTVLRRALVITGRIIAVTFCCLSLILCAAAAVLWVRGYVVVDVVDVPRYVVTPEHADSFTYRLSSGRGVVALNVERERTTWAAKVRVGSMRTQRRLFHVTLKPDQFRLQARTLWQKLGFNAHAWQGPLNLGAFTHGMRGVFNVQRSEWGVRLPYWLIVPATGVPPVLYLRRLVTWRRRSRVRRGLCGRCGYDLRASTGRCPECGEAIPERAAAAALGVAA